MKGTNTLKLNQETMCEAVQTWVQETFAGPHFPKVTAVKSDSGNSAYGGNHFEVTVETSDSQT